MRTVSFIAGFCGFALGCTSLVAQTPANSPEISELKSLVTAQQSALEQQQTQIQKLQSALAEQQEMLIGVMQNSNNHDPRLRSAVDRTTDLRAVDPYPQTTPNVQGQPVEEQLTLEQEEAQQGELQRGPEIADPKPDTPALALGPAKIRILGYPAMTALFRSTNSGGNVGTSFASLPFGNAWQGNTSEFRISPQSTRLALRADLSVGGTKAAGYFEMDFGGSPNPGNVAVTSSSYSFRLRQAFFEWQPGKWNFTGGQAFSLMTSLKLGITPWPGDVATTQVIDTNYVAGVVWGRYPQFRVSHTPYKNFWWGFSIENPEQQVGSNVSFPANLNSIVSNQYNTGSQELKVPNMTPDFVLKGDYDGKMSNGNRIHLDVGTVMRVFRSSNNPANVSTHDHAFGWGVASNFQVEVAKGYTLVLQGFASDGAGRYIGGLVPDVIVKANGQISPIHSYSWVSGLEIAPNKKTGVYFYYSGLYAQKNATLDSTGTCCVGFGGPGSNLNPDRYIQEATGGWSRVLWKFENVGSVQYGVQYAYVWLAPWVAQPGASQANANMVFGQFRYNLP
jgi:hypothetical protein